MFLDQAFDLGDIAMGHPNEDRGVALILRRLTIIINHLYSVFLSPSLALPLFCSDLSCHVLEEERKTCRSTINGEIAKDYSLADTNWAF